MTNYEKYKILATYDRELIEYRLGIKTKNLGEVHRIASQAFIALTPDEKAIDLDDINREMESLFIQKIGTKGGKAKTPAKVRASRENGRKGGRPRKQETN